MTDAPEFLSRVADVAIAVGWQDISTAPKDGSNILVATVREQGVAFYRDGKWRLGGMMYFDRPSHWRPLPAAPRPISERDAS